MKAIWKYVWMKERWGQSRSTRLANSWDVWASFNKELPLAFIKHVKRAQAIPSREDIWLSALFSSISLITTWFQAITFWMEIQISVKNPSPLFCWAPASLPTWTSILQQIEGSLILKDSQLLCQPHSIRDAWFGISQAAELCVLAWTESLDVLKLVLPEHCWTPASQHSQASSCLLSGKKLMDIPSTTWGWGCINSPTRWLHRREEAQHLPAQHLALPHARCPGQTGTTAPGTWPKQTWKPCFTELSAGSSPTQGSITWRLLSHELWTARNDSHQMHQHINEKEMQLLT